MASLAGWALDLPLLRGGGVTREGMVPAAAVGLILASGALGALNGRGGDRVGPGWLQAAGVGAALAAATLGAVAAGAYALGWDTGGLDLLLFAEAVRGAANGTPPGQMAPNTAFSLLSLGLALALLVPQAFRPVRRSNRGLRGLAAALAGLAFGVGFLASIGYLYGATGLYAIGGRTAMPPNSAVAVTFLALGILLSRPAGALGELVAGDDAGGMMIRRLLPMVILAPVAIGAARIAAVRAGLLDGDTATLFRTLVEVLLLLVIVLVTARRLRALDRERSRVLEAERVARDRAEQLQALAARLSAARTPAEVASATLEAGCRTVGLRQGSVFVVEDGERPRDTLALVHAVGYDPVTLEAWRRVPNTPATLAGDAVARREPVVLGRREALAARYPALRPLLDTTSYCGGAVFPLLTLNGEAGAGADEPAGAEEAVLGFVAFDFDEERDLARDEVAFLCALAQLSTQALERARLFEAEREAKEKAVSERRRLALVLDTLPVGAVVADGSGSIIHENPQCARILGHSLRSVDGVPAFGRMGGLHPDGRPYAAEDYPLARALLHGDRVQQELVRYRRWDGAEVTLSVSAVPVRDASGRVTFAVAAFEDVTEREMARAEAIEANQSKSQFLTNMSHELRTPLNAIIGHVQLVELGLHGPVTEAQLQTLGRVQRAGRHLLSLINDVLNYAKLEAGRVRFDLRPTVVGPAVREVVQLIEPQARAKGIELQVVHPRDADGAGLGGVVWADPDKLAQALFNLLTNAIKFTPALDGLGRPGRVTVEIAEPADRPDLAQLHIHDTGIGIPPDRLAAIFEPFVQVRSGYTREQEGAGLGLAITRDLVRGMGGDVWVRSRVGEGSTFTIAVPRVNGAGAGEPVAEPGPEPGDPA
jgi:PAS domain S-box-containing protein